MYIINTVISCDKISFAFFTVVFKQMNLKKQLFYDTKQRLIWSAQLEFKNNFNEQFKVTNNITE